MKILVLENDPKELSLIQQALNGKQNELIALVSSEQAWPLIESGGARFIIGNWDTSDMMGRQFISRARSAKLAEPLYIVLTTLKNPDDQLASVGADDIIQRPFKASDLKNRIAMAERIISLASNLASARNQLENQAVYDSLTGLMNRAAFFRQSAGELERSRRSSMSVSLIALDIDDFKSINKSFGKELGDEVLRVFSQMIREKSRPYDCICRWEADKFVIMLAGVIGADAEKVADRIIAGIRGTRIEVESKTSVNLKISAGIASVPRVSTSTEVEPMINQAFQAMARAKEAGGNQVFVTYG
jgi:two-component system cell cycle response regulator